MRLAINAISLAPGGGLTGLLGYLRAWGEISSPMSITVFASRPAVLDAVRACRSDIRVEAFLVTASRARRFFFERLGLGRHIERAGADVILATNCLVGRCRVAQLVHHRNVINFMDPREVPSLYRKWPERIRMRYARKAVMRSAINVYISHYMRQRAEQLFPESARKNHVVYHGLSSEVLQRAREAPREYDGSPNLLAVQSSMPYKGNETLLDMMQRLLADHPKVPWRLTIAGAGEWSSIEALARKRGLSNSIVCAGFLPGARLDPLFRRSLALVFPSWIEGFGHPLLEAMVRGCPVIAVDATAMPEILGGAGLLVPPCDPMALAAHVVRLYNDRDFREGQVTKGLRRAESFRWTDSAEQMHHLLELAAGQGPTLGAGGSL